jgi:hypothetical protein
MLLTVFLRWPAPELRTNTTGQRWQRNREAVGDSEFEGVPSAEWHVKRAYIIDDDDGFLKSLEFLLSSHGWKVDGFQSAKPFISLERS